MQCVLSKHTLQLWEGGLDVISEEDKAKEPRLCPYPQLGTCHLPTLPTPCNLQNSQPQPQPSNTLPSPDHATILLGLSSPGTIYWGNRWVMGATPGKLHVVLAHSWGLSKVLPPTAQTLSLYQVWFFSSHSCHPRYSNILHIIHPPRQFALWDPPRMDHRMRCVEHSHPS